MEGFLREVADDLAAVKASFRTAGVQFCVIGDYAVSAFTDLMIGLDLQVVSAEPHEVRICSRLRVHVQTNPPYVAFLAKATEGEVLGVSLPFAAIEDVLQGTIWALADATRVSSKRLLDLSDIARIIENYPHLRARVPAAVIEKLP